MSAAIRAIKDRLNLVDLAQRYLRVRQNGARYVAPCPFHQETKPSFSINNEKGLFYCFGCQASGDIIDFYGKINGIDFRESVAQLAEELGIVIDGPANPQAIAANKKARTEKQMMLEMHREASQHFAGNLTLNIGSECREYINKRGLGEEIIKRFELGWASREWHDLSQFLFKRGHNAEIAQKCGLISKSANGNFYDRFRGRLIFPIKNLSNQVIAFGGRIIADEDEAKYINSSDTPIYGKKEHLYGLAQARRAISAKGEAILTEGYMDVITLHQFGYDNSVGVLGTALTDEQIRRLSGFASHIVLLFDGDRPGRKAALRGAEMLLTRGLACSVVLLPETEDIDSLLRSKGPQEFDNLRENAADGLTYCINTLTALAPKEALNWARNFLAQMQIPELTSHYATQLSRKLGISENLLRESVNPSAARGASYAVSSDLCHRDTQILLFAVRYPERLEDLRELGADLALTHDRSRAFWDIIERYGPDEAIYHLDEKQKNFWLASRGPLAAPLDNGANELACLKEDLEKFYAKSQLASLQSALARKNNNENFDADLEYLQAIREAMRKDNEQS